jgi:AcrR family transcriptional regulator
MSSNDRGAVVVTKRATQAATPDRRTVRTRQALLGAFVELMFSDGFDAISVARIAARANVGRSTFYLHYRSREDILKATLSRPSAPLADVVDHELAPAALLPLLAHFHEQRRMSRVFFGGGLRRMWVDCLAGMIEPRLSALARRARARPLLPLPLAAVQVAEMQLALVLHWLAGKDAARPEAVAEAIVASTRAIVCVMLAVDGNALSSAQEKSRR